MLNFEGKGYIYRDNEKISKTRDEIIKSGWKHNANIPKVNEILRKFHTYELNPTEMLEYIIRDSAFDMKLNSVPPKLSDFGLTENRIAKINNIDKLLFIIGVVIYFGGAVLLVKYANTSLSMNLIHKMVVVAYVAICIFYLQNNKEYSINKKMFKNYKKVSTVYANRYKELEQIAKDREKKRIEIERRKREELRRRNEEIKRRKMREQKEYWYSLNPYEFEEKIGELFRDLGYKVTVTKKSGDGGIDAIIQKGNVLKAVQCKKYKEKVTGPYVRDLWGAKDYVEINSKIIKADGAIMVALSGVTTQAKAFIKHFPTYELWTIDTILEKANLVNYSYAYRNVNEKEVHKYTQNSASNASRLCNLILEYVPIEYKIAVLKEIRKLKNCGLEPAKDLIERAPCVLCYHISYTSAFSIKNTFENIGAKIIIEECK